MVGKREDYLLSKLSPFCFPWLKKNSVLPGRLEAGGPEKQIQSVRD